MKIIREMGKGVVCLLLAVAAGPVSAQTVEYIHTDALGTPVAVTNSAGVVVERSEYEPYGALLNRPITDGPGFTGHVQDAATGLTYMQQRYYDPTIGRFLSVDPVTANSGTGANFNRYWYANNNPYKFTDPDGRAPKGCGGGTCERKDWRSIAARSPGSASAIRVTSVNSQSAKNTIAPSGAKTVGPLKSGYVYGSSGREAPSPTSSGTPGNGTFSIGVHASAAGLAKGEAGIGLAGDVRGNIAIYTTSAVGAAIGGDVDISLNVSFSNASSVKELGGTGTALSVGGGALGHLNVEGARSAPSADGKVITSGGGSVGLGGGLSGSASQTNTTIYQLGDER